ncbi:hypothetical protein [Paracoccus fistulariae]|uniref:DUF2946 domain-containing protein n=1 Tax=Paracoccus fistulariae TaxID=658446 RepID=A0ABY7SKG0_9RHOB|nr:hypothetical protein [Paracoccus fistulariae]MDB6181460.1 hypothetical protein [Paracoccus fistulariae]WCR07499.1 hypothetical protein JHX87_01195 [Paracoccus fistulariae]
MFRDATGYGRVTRAAFGLLIAFALLLRLFGPAGALPARDGYLAICTGTEIIYVEAASLGFPTEKSPDSPDRDHQAEACLWFSGLYAVELAATTTPDAGQRLYVRQAARIRADQRGDQRPAPAFHARGPPALS